MSAPRAFLVSAPASGAGKTTITMGLIAAFRRRGLAVQTFKTGPDYVDSAYHSKLSGRPCINLDSWMTPESFVKETFARHAQGADVLVIEGVMGLFDGATDGTGSSAQIARLLSIPILHVIDASKSAQSAAAVLHGMESFDPELTSIGAVFNRIASPRHWTSVADTVASGCRTPNLGYLPRNKDLTLPERQLGLVSAFEHGLPDTYVNALADALEAHVDLDALLSAAPGPERPAPPAAKIPATAARLGIARDDAFCFYYQDNLDLLKQAGIELVPFSPLNDDALPASLDGIYFGGGFPEEFAGRLAQNQRMLDAVRTFEGRILAECGGLIYLCTTFSTIDGTQWPMAGRISGEIEMTESLQSFGYREVALNRDTLLGPKGTRLRGHEFHWSRWRHAPAHHTGAFQTDDRAWGYADERVLASYFHIHFGSNPETARRFCEALQDA